MFWFIGYNGGAGVIPRRLIGNRRYILYKHKKSSHFIYYSGFVGAAIKNKTNCNTRKEISWARSEAARACQSFRRQPISGEERGKHPRVLVLGGHGGWGWEGGGTWPPAGEREEERENKRMREEAGEQRLPLFLRIVLQLEFAVWQV